MRLLSAIMDPYGSSARCFCSDNNGRGRSIIVIKKIDHISLFAPARS